MKPKQGFSSSFWLSNEHIFIPYCDHRAPGTSANAEELWRGRHGRNSPAAPGARPAQTSSLLHPMRTDVPEDDPRILGTDKSGNESGRDLNGVEWWPVPSGALSQQHVPDWKGQSAGVCNRDKVPWHSIIFTRLYSATSWSKIFKIFSKYAEKMHVSCALCFIFIWNVVPKILTRRHYFSAHLCIL